MLTYFNAIILGLVQGITELFPISSLGHSVILPTLLGWNINQNDNFFLIFLVGTHLATSLVLLGFFFKDWTLIIRGIFRSLKNRVIDPADTYAKLGWLIIIGTIPAGIVGILFEKNIQALFATPMIAAVFLFINGVVLWGIEMFKKGKNSRVATSIDSNNSAGDEHMAKMTWGQSVKIGCVQCFALIPGFSRTGMTLGAGLFSGLNHEDSARFSFLLATPIIFAAAVLKLPELYSPTYTDEIGILVVGVIAAAIAAYLSVRFLLKYFQTKNLKPFGLYCIVFGALSICVLFFRS